MSSIMFYQPSFSFPDDVEQEVTRRGKKVIKRKERKIFKEDESRKNHQSFSLFKLIREKN